MAFSLAVFDSCDRRHHPYDGVSFGGKAGHDRVTICRPNADRLRFRVPPRCADPGELRFT